MRILLIKPKHIGDTLLLTPTLVALRQAHPGAEIWVVVRRGCESILAGCPEIDRLLTVATVDPHERTLGDLGSTLATMARLAGRKFDYVFELGDGTRGRFLARLPRTKHRYSVRPAPPLDPAAIPGFTAVAGFEWETIHRVEKDFYAVSEFLPLPEPIPPLRFDRRFARPWPAAENLRDFAVIQIGKRQPKSRWSRERWEEVGRALRAKLPHLIITSGSVPHETEEALWLCDRLGPGTLATLGRADWPQVADLLYRARLYVGTDTATMHLAAACGCPAVALFGPTWEGNWRPWRAPHRIVVPAGDTATNVQGSRRRSMEDIAPAQVIAACLEMLSADSGARPGA